MMVKDYRVCCQNRSRTRYRFLTLLFYPLRVCNISHCFTGIALPVDQHYKFNNNKIVAIYKMVTGIPAEYVHFQHHSMTLQSFPLAASAITFLFASISNLPKSSTSKELLSPSLVIWSKQRSIGRSSRS